MTIVENTISHQNLQALQLINKIMGPPHPLLIGFEMEVSGH